MGNQCVASGGAPFDANIVFSNKTPDLTLKEPAEHKCRRGKCDKKHHKGLYMNAGKVPEGWEPASTVTPLGSTSFKISAREGTAAGPDGELHYDVWCDGKNMGSVTLYFSRDANSSTRSQNVMCSGLVNGGDYELLGNFPADTTHCTFELRKRKVEVRLKGRLSAVFGGGDLDMVVPVEDILKLEELQTLIGTVAQVGGTIDKLKNTTEALQKQGVKLDFVSAHKPGWWPL